MSFLLGSVFLDVCLVLVSLVAVFTAYVQHAYRYWERKKVPYLKPKFPLGNNWTLFPKGISVGIISKKFYNEFKQMGHKLGGVYYGIQPKLVIVDPDYVKDVLTKDFQSFVDRGVYQNESDPISVNIFSQPGDEWRNARVKFSAIFSSAKLKMMLQKIVECSAGMEEALEKLCKQKSDVDFIEVAGCFTTDVIGSCGFGISCNSFKYPDAEFRNMGKKVFEEFSISHQLNLFLTLYCPDIATKLGIGNIQKDVSKLFFKNFRDMVDYREKNNIYRDDFLQLLIEHKNSETKFGMDELTAQSFVFFLAGFETSSHTTTQALYELGKNQEVQDRVREEIIEVLKRHDNKITYEALAEMKYLEQVIDETLRLWPAVSTITRACTKDYTFRDSDVTIEKGTGVYISALGFHHDPEYWPEPMTWDPDRFSDENKESRRPFTYLPFGEGPRNCVGLRFGQMQSKVGLIAVLKNFKVSVSPKTREPLGLDPDTFVAYTINKVFLNLEKVS